MLFPQGLFSPDFLTDLRARAVLAEVARQLPDGIRPSDIVAVAVRTGDVDLLGTLTQALRPGVAVQDLLKALPPVAPAPTPRAQRGPEAFTPQTLQAFGEFEQVYNGSGGVLAGVALELLLFFVLGYLDDSERKNLACLDIRRATTLFRDKLNQVMDPRPSRSGGPNAASPGSGHRGPENDREPFQLPPKLAPSDDLTQRARSADGAAAFPFDGDVRYEQVFDAICRALHRRQPGHVLLLGERGVGKTLLVAELARRAATGRIPFLANRRFVAIDCRYVPADESRQRLAAILAHVADRPDLVVSLDGLAGLLRTDRGPGNKLVLLAALAHAHCRVLGLLTPREYEEFFTDDPDLHDHFQRVDVEEPDPEVAQQMLRHLSTGLEQRYRATIDAEAVRQAVLLSANYILNDQLPAKALKLLHRACEDLDYERGQLGAPRNRVSADDIIHLVAQRSGVPEETLRGIAERSDYEKSLQEVVFGQEHAVREVATELGLIKAGMTDSSKPASVMLFLGQTGTGKTEMAKALARFYSSSKRLKTYTLGNCVEPHSVATIIGVPPGYVGNDQGGRLINELNADPYCVFLLDEADKAHPDVLQPFLNLFDEGWVCDQRGVRAYASKSIFILTSNVGQRMIVDMLQQGKPMDEITARMKEALSQIRHTKSDRPVFTPEFLARIKRIIVFHPLGREAMAGIARKQVSELREGWRSQRGKVLEVPEALVGYLGEQGHALNEKSKGKEGSRIVRKLLSEWVEATLQRAISEDPVAYRACGRVVLEFTRPTIEAATETPAASTESPRISLRFLPAGPG